MRINLEKRLVRLENNIKAKQLTNYLIIHIHDDKINDENEVTNKKNEAIAKHLETNPQDANNNFEFIALRRFD